MDTNLKRLGAVVGLSVKDRDLTTPPASPVDGDRYIIPAATTGVGPARPIQIAVRVASAWEYHTCPRSVGFASSRRGRASAYKSAGWSAGIAI